MPLTRDLLHVLGRLNGQLAEAPSLDAIAKGAGWSPFHLHRVFSRVVGETPKRYALRVRLETAAARLVATDESVCDVALATGFKSHEVFTRAFRRHFGQPPARYRASALQGVPHDVRVRHRSLIESATPCVGLYHTTIHSSQRRHTMPTLSIDRRELAEQPVLVVRLRPARHEIAAAIGEGLGKAFPYSQRSGAALAGRPFARYLSTGPGLFDIEVGIPLTAAVAGEGEVKAGTLPGGPAVMGVHGGPYDQLSETYAAMERWIEANGLRIAGAPWESYVTDPVEQPDPKDWRTEIFWPVADATRA